MYVECLIMVFELLGDDNYQVGCNFMGCGCKYGEVFYVFFECLDFID